MALTAPKELTAPKIHQLRRDISPNPGGFLRVSILVTFITRGWETNVGSQQQEGRVTMASPLKGPSSLSSPISSSHKFKGSSPIAKYQMLEKLGEGTFGYEILDKWDS